MGLDVQQRDGELTFRVRVAPRASRTAVLGLHGEAMKVALCAPPVDGAANSALIAFLAKSLSVPKRNITIVRGDRGRDKLLKVSGVEREDLEALAAGSSR